VKGYAAHERDVFEEVTRARASVQRAGTASQTATADNQLTAALGHLFAVVESYPTLQASATFMSLRGDLSDLEAKIALARQFYNRNVLDYNTRLETVPDSIVASMFAFAPAEFFEADETERADIRVRFTAADAAPAPGPPATAA
jgi:LemA protein